MESTAHWHWQGPSPGSGKCLSGLHFVLIGFKVSVYSAKWPSPISTCHFVMFIDSACNLQRICKVLGSHLAIWTASRIIKVILTGLQCRVAHRTRPLGFWHPLAFCPIQSQLLPDVVAVWFYIDASPIRFRATSIQRNDTKRYETAQSLFCHVWWGWGPPGSVDLWALGSLLLALFAPQIKARKSRQRRQRNNTLYTVCFDWSPARWIQKPQPIIKPNWMCPSSFSKAARFASRKTPWHVGRCVTEMARLVNQPSTLNWGHVHVSRNPAGACLFANLQKHKYHMSMYSRRQCPSFPLASSKRVMLN